MNDCHVQSHLVLGDAVQNRDTDLIVQVVHLPVGKAPETVGLGGNGWRVMTGNENQNMWARVCYRIEALTNSLVREVKDE